MKKVLLIALALMVMLAPACSKKQDGQNDKMMAAYMAPTAITITYAVKKTGDCSVTVTEDCTDCTTPTPQLKIPKDPSTGAVTPGKLTWKVTFSGFDNGTETPQATIGNFQKLDFSTGGYTPTAVNPFISGTTLPFSFTPGADPLSVYSEKIGSYKYTLTITWKDKGTSKMITDVLDPRVVFDY